MFMYRYLPLIATLAEGKPITFGFERPYETFLFETILFLISSLAFYLACQNIDGNQKNNIIQKSLFELRFFEITPAIIWVMGCVGFLIRIYNFSAGDVEYGNAGGKFLLGLNYLMYAPLCLIFPSFMNVRYSNQKFVWIYIAVIFIINIASNSRQSIIAPIGILAILFLMYLVVNNLRVTDYLSSAKIVFLGLFLFLILNLLSNISIAMLYTRKIRSDVNKLELFQKTIATIGDEALMSQLKAEQDKVEGNQFISYRQGWTEQYIDNFMLARYANMRITDQTLYYAEKKGYGNMQMRDDFIGRVIALFPTPILRFFRVYLDKGSMEFSRGDILYGSGFGGYRVTSHLGDGLATFGFWYFPIQFLAFFGVFKLLNCFVFHGPKGIRYAPFALMGVFGFLGMFRNANGVIADIGYILRGFLQGVVTYLILYYSVRYILWMVNPKYVKNKDI